MTPSLLREIGEALYGPRWASEFARAVGVSDRLVRFWLSGERPIPAPVQAAAWRLLREREIEINRLLAPVSAAA